MLSSEEYDMTRPFVFTFLIIGTFPDMAPGLFTLSRRSECWMGEKLDSSPDLL